MVVVAGPRVVHQRGVDHRCAVLGVEPKGGADVGQHCRRVGAGNGAAAIMVAGATDTRASSDIGQDRRCVGAGSGETEIRVANPAGPVENFVFRQASVGRGKDLHFQPCVLDGVAAPNDLHSIRTTQARAGAHRHGDWVRGGGPTAGRVAVAGVEEEVGAVDRRMRAVAQQVDHDAVDAARVARKVGARRQAVARVIGRLVGGDRRVVERVHTRNAAIVSRLVVKQILAHDRRGCDRKQAATLEHFEPRMKPPVRTDSTRGGAKAHLRARRRLPAANRHPNSLLLSRSSKPSVTGCHGSGYCQYSQNRQ